MVIICFRWATIAHNLTPIKHTDMFIVVNTKTVTAAGLYVPKRTITVSNIREARKLAPHYEHVATCGPTQQELQFTHPSHIVETFQDSLDSDAATLQQVENLLNWYHNLSEGAVLVHCHAGVSRSTGVAVGFHLVDGASAFEAVLAVMGQQPFEDGERRVCWPNGMIVSWLDVLFGVGVAEVVGELCD